MFEFPVFSASHCQLFSYYNCYFPSVFQAFRCRPSFRSVDNFRIYFVKDKLPANSSFSHFYKKFNEEEDVLLKKAYLKRKIREGSLNIKRLGSKKVSYRSLKELESDQRLQ
jgi:hypothetical protein